MGNEKKQQLVLIIGFALIFFVIILTLFRSTLLPTAKTGLSAPDSSQKSDAKPSDYPSISAKDLQKKLMLTSRSDGITLLDVRPFESYIAEHLLDSINIPVDEFPAGSKIDAHSQVFIIGASADDSDIPKAMAKLKDEDIKNAIVLAGGMEAWKQFIGITVTYGDPKSFVDQSKVSYVDGEKLNEALSSKAPMFIVDTRPNESFTKGHIPGAINIPMDELEKRRSEIKEKRVVVIGATELEEFQASVQMYDMLLVSPFVVRGAMPGWQEKGFPITQ